MLKSFLRSNPLVSALSSKVVKRHVERRTVRARPRHLARVVADVDSYAQFLPLCARSEVVRRRSPTSFDAVLSVGLTPTLSETYASRVTVVEEDDDTFVVRAESIDDEASSSSSAVVGLTSEWRIRGAPDGDATRSDVEFRVEMTVDDPVLGAALEGVWDTVARRQVEAFERRCRESPYDHRPASAGDE